MKLNDEKIGYQLQRKYLKEKKISGFKVGASNFRSADFFGYSGILLGGIEDNGIFWGNINKDYSVAEVEVVAKIYLDSQSYNHYKVIDYYLGIECPLLSVDNPDGSPFICLADNCAAGHLIIYEKIEITQPENVHLYINEKKICTGGFHQLKFPINIILDKTVQLLKTHNLTRWEREIFIATGGLTDTFSLSRGDIVEFNLG